MGGLSPKNRFRIPVNRYQTSPDGNGTVERILRNIVCVRVASLPLNQLEVLHGMSCVLPVGGVEPKNIALKGRLTNTNPPHLTKTVELLFRCLCDAFHDITRQGHPSEPEVAPGVIASRPSAQDTRHSFGHQCEHLFFHRYGMWPLRGSISGGCFGGGDSGGHRSFGALCASLPPPPPESCHTVWQLPPRPRCGNFPPRSGNFPPGVATFPPGVATSPTGVATFPPPKLPHETSVGTEKGRETIKTRRFSLLQGQIVHRSPIDVATFWGGKLPHPTGESCHTRPGKVATPDRGKLPPGETCHT